MKHQETTSRKLNDKSHTKNNISYNIAVVYNPGVENFINENHTKNM